MAQFIRFESLGEAELAESVAAALRQGAVVLPLSGAYAVATSRPDRPGAKFARPFRPDPNGRVPAAWGFAGEAKYRAGVERLLARGAVGLFDRGTVGVIADSGSLVGRVSKLLAGALWVSLPVAPMQPGQMAEELTENVGLVVTGVAESAGPTVVDFTARPAVVDRRGNLGILDVEQELGELVRLAPGIGFEVLVVCTGNLCRSPMAEGLLGSMLEESARVHKCSSGQVRGTAEWGNRVHVRSAGTGAPVGMTATNQAIEAAGELGVDLKRHRASLLGAEMIESADLVLVMERYHREEVVRLVPGAARKTKLLLSFTGRDIEVDDPVGRPVEAYRRTIAQMRPALERLAEDIRFRMGKGQGTDD